MKHEIFDTHAIIFDTHAMLFLFDGQDWAIEKSLSLEPQQLKL